MSFPVLFERAGAVAVGDFVGGDYVFDASIQLGRAHLTGFPATDTATVLDLIIGGQLTGYQVVIPSGVNEVSLWEWFDPPVAVVTGPNGLTPSVRWQCISGSANVATSAAQLDLVAWAERLVAFPPGVIPFSGGSLMSPAISEGNVEGAAQALFAEWLGDYFDGNPHMIGVNASGVFPTVLVRFEQGEIQQPLNQIDVNPSAPQLEIRLTVARRPESRLIAAQGWLITAPVTLSFWVRAKKQGRGQGPYLARTASELLYSILQNPENTLALAEKGIKHLAPKGGVTIPSKEWSEMLVAVNGEFSWYSYFQT